MTAIVHSPNPEISPSNVALRRTGAEIIWEVLLEEGVETVFGYPGGAIMPAYDALLSYPKIHHVLVRHEQSAAHMADGFARASGNVGVAIATSGPGATNLATGIATAMLDSSPIVCITGQVNAKLLGSDAFQEIDITGITLPITKHNYLVTKIEELADSLREAFAIARSGRPGPVLVDVTKDVQQATIDYVRHTPNDSHAAKFAHVRRPLPPIDPATYDLVAQWINEARRPLILAGQGVIQSGAMKELIALAEKAKIPVAQTLLGLGGFPSTHPLSLGMMGMHGEVWVNTAIQQTDLLIALGMRFDDRVTGNLRNYAVGARKVHIDIDLSEINKNVRVDMALLADIKHAVNEIEPRVERQERAPWIEHIRILKGNASVRDIQQLPHEGRLFAAHVIHDLWRITEGKAVVVTDVGQHQMWEAQYYKHDFARRLITSGGLGTMGFAVPAGLGAKHAKPDDEVWVICGDGGFQMTQAELQTAAQEGVKINIAIINNGYLGMVRQWQQFFYEGRYSATPLKSPDFVKLAEAHGLVGLRVSTREELPEIVQRARTEKGTVVIDFRVEQEDSVYPMVPTGADLGQMIQRPSPIVETPIEDSAKDPMRVLGPAPKLSEPPKSPITERIVIALVEDKPGVLNRVASLFRRRAFNITSLTVGRTHKSGVSRLTLTTEATEDDAKRIEAHLYKLVEVMYVKDVTHMACVESDLALIKVHVDDDSRTEVLDICRNFGARAVDATGGTLMIEITASREQLDSILGALRPYEIEEMVRTGMIAMTRGPLQESK